jgi:hypothetical protein
MGVRPPAALLLAALALAIPAVVLANPLGDEIRIQDLDLPGTNRGGYETDVAFNSGTGEYLVAYTADALVTDNDDEIFVRRLSTAGATVGDPQRVSTTGTEGVANEFADLPAVAADATNQRYLVVWASKASGYEVFAQLVDAAGQEIGTDIRISEAGTEADTLNSSYPDVVWNPANQEYFVVFTREVVEGEMEVHGQRVSKDGAPIGNDIRLSTNGTDGDGRRSYVPRIAYNSASDEYLVVFYANKGDPSGFSLNLDVFSQRVDADGAELGGAADTRLTTTGTDTDLLGSQLPAVAYNPILGDYLIAYESDVLADNDLEVYLQRLTSAGALNGGATQATTTPGASTDGYRPDVGYTASLGAGNYLLAWEVGGGPSGSVVLGQRLTGVAAETGPEFQVGSTAAGGIGTGHPRVAARTGEIEWMTSYYSSCRPDHNAEPFARRVHSGAAAPSPTCAAGAVASPSPSPVVTQAPPVETVAPVLTPTVVPKTSPTPAPVAKVLASQVFTLPSTRKCASRRKFTIRLKRPAGTKLVSAVVTVNGKKVKTVKGSRLTAPVDLRGLPKGRFTVKITATLSDGRKVSSTRKYKTCAPKQKR